jgi:hypothetical protein
MNSVTFIVLAITFIVVVYAIIYWLFNYVMGYDINLSMIKLCDSCGFNNGIQKTTKKNDKK